MGEDEEDARGDEGFNKGGRIVFRGLWGKPTVASAAGETLMRDVQKGDKVGTRFSPCHKSMSLSKQFQSVGSSKQAPHSRSLVLTRVKLMSCFQSFTFNTPRSG